MKNLLPILPIAILTHRSVTSSRKYCKIKIYSYQKKVVSWSADKSSAFLMQSLFVGNQQDRAASLYLRLSVDFYNASNKAR